MSFNASPNSPDDLASFAANRSGLDAPGTASAGLLQVLAQANDFTLEDLQANFIATGVICYYPLH